MPRIIERNTEKQRTVAFLKELYAMIVEQGDNMPRVTYTAMHYRLGQPTVAAAQRTGIIRRNGWRWAWTGGRPGLAMAERVTDQAKDIRRAYAANYARNQYRRIHG